MSRSGWAIGIVVALVLILLLGAGVIASSSWSRGYGCGMGPGMMGWGGVPFMGPIFGVVLICLFIGGVVWFAQSRSGEPPGPGSGRAATETPLEILKRRYASGELTKKQFEEMRRTIDK